MSEELKQVRDAIDILYFQEQHHKAVVQAAYKIAMDGIKRPEPQVDVEGLKKSIVDEFYTCDEIGSFEIPYDCDGDSAIGFCIDHLHEQGYLRTPAITKEEAQAAYDELCNSIETVAADGDCLISGWIEGHAIDTIHKLLKQSGAK